MTLLINAQILKSIPSSLDVVFPEPVRALFAALDVTALNPFTLIAGEVRRVGRTLSVRFNDSSSTPSVPS